MKLLEIIKNGITRLKKYCELIKKGYFLKFFSAVFVDFLRLPFYFIPHDGVKVVEEDWDYLIVLDACRFDTFKKLNDIEGELEKKTSLGSYTTEWGNKNFDGYYDDIVYVSGNPRICDSMIRGFKGGEHFHDVIDVWDKGWDEELGTVPSEEMTKATMNAKEEYPDKKLIIHYMQPHAPHIGETRISFENPDELLRVKIQENEKFVRAYEDNLKIVLEEVKSLIGNLDGKIVITSDHGEAIGKEPFTHPHHVHINRLTEIPWFEVNKEETSPMSSFSEKERIKDSIRNLKSKKDI